MADLRVRELKQGKTNYVKINESFQCYVKWSVPNNDRYSIKVDDVSVPFEIVKVGGGAGSMSCYGDTCTAKKRFVYTAKAEGTGTILITLTNGRTFAYPIEVSGSENIEWKTLNITLIGTQTFVNEKSDVRNTFIGVLGNPEDRQIENVSEVKSYKLPNEYVYTNDITEIKYTEITIKYRRIKESALISLIESELSKNVKIFKGHNLDIIQTLLNLNWIKTKGTTNKEDNGEEETEIIKESDKSFTTMIFVGVIVGIILFFIKGS